MTDPVAAVTEAEATGEIAAIFADIRAVYGVSVVNLVWRHLATFPGALPWAWGTLRPLYVAGIIAEEADALRAARRLPAMPTVPAEVFAAVGLSQDDMRQVGIVLDAYERTNPMALVALSVLEQHLTDPPASITLASITPARRREQPARGAEADLSLPPLLRLDQMAPTTVALVLRLNRIGAVGNDPVLASMYRNLAHWPAYLGLAWALLAPLDAEGRLSAAIADTLAAARARGRAIAEREPAPLDALSGEQRAEVAAAIGRFTGDAICRMAVICGALRSAGIGA